MTKAICFNCKRTLPIGKSLEGLLEDRLPVFCCQSCANEFPDNGTDEFEQRLKTLKLEIANNSKRSEEPK